LDLSGEEFLADLDGGKVDDVDPDAGRRWPTCATCWICSARKATRRATDPQPGLADVPTLLDRLTEAGLAIDLRRSGEEQPLPPGVDLAAYRIVQEALTNVLKHGDGSTASLSLAYRDAGVEIEVVNGLARPSAVAVCSGHGHGLVGMRERAAMYGGTWTAGVREGGDFAVRVHLPAAPP
jgi:signal transduction histidine kinase